MFAPGVEYVLGSNPVYFKLHVFNYYLYSVQIVQ